MPCLYLQRRDFAAYRVDDIHPLASTGMADPDIAVGILCQQIDRVFVQPVFHVVEHPEFLSVETCEAPAGGYPYKPLPVL